MGLMLCRNNNITLTATFFVEAVAAVGTTDAATCSVTASAAKVSMTSW
jgi:hypothetical protein